MRVLRVMSPAKGKKGGSFVAASPWINMLVPETQLFRRPLSSKSSKMEMRQGGVARAHTPLQVCARR